MRLANLSTTDPLLAAPRFSASSSTGSAFLRPSLSASAMFSSSVCSNYTATKKNFAGKLLRWSAIHISNLHH